MFLKNPKNNEKYQWTQHSVYKMRQYGLSPQRVIRVIRNPERTEVGIVENTIAVMQPSSTRFKNGKKTWSQEIWAMYQLRRAGNLKSEIRNPKQIQNNKIQNLKANKLTKLIPKKLKIISVWRYPGVSPKNNPIPDEILREVQKAL
jgi:hypothetical protein